MKIGTNFDTGFYYKSKKHNRDLYGDRFHITNFHLISFFFKDILRGFLILFIYGIGIGLIWYLVQGFVMPIKLTLLLIFFLLLYIGYRYVLYLNTFVVFNPNEIIIYQQSGLLTRNITVLPSQNIKALHIVPDSWLCTFLGYGTLKILVEGIDSQEDIEYIPNLQDLQFHIRELSNPNTTETSI